MVTRGGWPRNPPQKYNNKQENKRDMYQSNTT